MRAILALLGLAAVALVVLMALGMVKIEQTSDTAFPTIKFEGGRAPEFKAEVGRVGIGTENATVAVPTIKMENTTIAVPTLEVEKPGNTAAPAN